ncbi:MAG: hypothetical protein JNL62_09410 [Bryobacterales bacterium]|nr:hypothetical protein [Bryobacterales bacterium]
MMGSLMVLAVRTLIGTNGESTAGIEVFGEQRNGAGGAFDDRIDSRGGVLGRQCAEQGGGKKQHVYQVAKSDLRLPNSMSRC